MSEESQAIAEEILSGPAFRRLVEGKAQFGEVSDIYLLGQDWYAWREAGGTAWVEPKKKFSPFDPPEWTPLNVHFLNKRDRGHIHPGFHKSYGRTFKPNKKIIDTRFLRVRWSQRVFQDWFTFRMWIGNLEIVWNKISKKTWTTEPQGRFWKKDNIYKAE